jgi:sulfatase maturation enzyme AslB (radical SAM superfamily)
MINPVDTILFSESLTTIEQKFRSARKDVFDHNDRIVIEQDIPDTYPYIDSAGVKLIEIQKIINQVDISNCFILLITSNADVENEIGFITKFYSVDPNPIDFSIVNGDYKKEIIKYDNTACKKLWNHLYVGTDSNINPCCLADHRFPLGNINDNSIIYSDKSNQFRNWMKQGYRPVACQTCYIKEDSNIASARIKCDPNEQTIDITSLDIRINNICNFKCRMCSEYFSSAIQQETIKIYGKDAVLGHEQNLLTSPLSIEKSSQFDAINSYITSKVTHIYFAGGEPLMTAEHYQTLDKLIDIEHTDLLITYNTNLSKLTYKNINVLDYWNQFSNILVGASIDASDSVAEYVRYGTVWNEIVENIHKIKQHAPGVSLKITSTASFLTIENLINLQNKWINEKVFDVSDLTLTVLISPSYLSPAALPAHHKQRLRKIILNHIDKLGKTGLAMQWQDVLSYMMNNDYTHTLSDFVQRTRVLDHHRNESFVTVFPEFKDLL